MRTVTGDKPLMSLCIVMVDTSIPHWSLGRLTRNPHELLTYTSPSKVVSGSVGIGLHPDSCQQATQRERAKYSGVYHITLLFDQSRM